jgi:hypothetical protein
MTEEQTPREGLSLAPFSALVGEEIVDLVFELAPSKVRNRVIKALDHYTKALRLVGIDDEMGAIRCIAAEEELVIAIFEWVKLNADKVPEHRDFIGRGKNHRVKLAFYPVLSQLWFAIGDMLVNGITMPGLEGRLHWHLSAVRSGDQVKLQIRDEHGKELIEFNPLDLSITQDDKPLDAVIDSLFNELTNNISDQRGISVREFVTERADYSNKLLYAQDAGFVAMAEDLDTLIRDRFSVILRDLIWCLAVLLSDRPLLPHWGLISQFIALYRRVLVEAKVLRV